MKCGERVSQQRASANLDIGPAEHQLDRGAEPDWAGSDHHRAAGSRTTVKGRKIAVEARRKAVPLPLAGQPSAPALGVVEQA